MGMSGSSGASPGAPLKAGAVKSDINITPLVDVVLVLLIIFMVVTPMLQKGQSVKLPITENPDKKPDEKSQIMVVIAFDPSVTKNNPIWIEKEKMFLRDFDPKIKEAFERNPAGTVVVKADSRLTFGDVKDVVFKIRNAGFRNVGLITEKKSS
jgi:biopolymer transport protein ExbD